MALKLAFDHDATAIIFGTGASQTSTGVYEGEFTYRWAINNRDLLAPLVGFTDFGDEAGLAFESWLSSKVRLDIISQNTPQECDRAIALCIDEGIAELFLVSSPWHTPRCLREALKVTERLRENACVPRIRAAASYGSMEGLVIVEPPHRADRSPSQLHLLIPRILKVKEEAPRSALEADIAALLHRYHV